MSKPVLTFSQKEADLIYDELRNLHVELDSDPLVFGPKRLNNKVATLRGMLDRCERIFLDVAQRLHAVTRRLLASNTDLEMAKKVLYAEDPETRAGRSVSDRDAIASGKLKNEVQECNRLERVKMALESTLMVVKAKRTDLKDTQGRLRDQLKLCQEEIGLGNRWGSRAPGAADLKPTGAAAEVADIDDILQGVDGEIHLAEQKGDWEDPPTMEQPDEEDDEEDEEDEDESDDDLMDADAIDPAADGDAPEPEPELDLGDDAPDLDSQLKSTATTDQIDSFLDGDDIAPPVGKPELDETSVDEILASFEKM